jgi:hypothetical protein
MQDTPHLIDPSDGDAAYREVFASTVGDAGLMDQDLFDALLEVVAPGAPKGTDR